MARTTKRSEVVSMVATCGYPLAVLALRKYRVEKEVLGYFLTSGKCTPMSEASGSTFPYACYDSKNAKISTCNRRPFRLSISAHFVKAVKEKMLVTDCQKARMQSSE